MSDSVPASPVADLIKSLRLESDIKYLAAADEIERLCRQIVICAKQSALDEGAIGEIASKATEEEYFNYLWGDVTDDEVELTAYGQQ